MNIAIVTLFAVISALLLIGVLAARQYRRTYGPAHLKRHRASMKSVFFLVVAGVLILEIAIRLGKIPSGGHEFFWVHLVFAVPFFILTTVLVFWKNGIRSPHLHKKLGYTCLALFLGTLVTGTLFLYT